MKLSIVIPARDKNEPQLKRLLASIDNQMFPPEEREIHIVTEGNSEEAKAIGISQSKGKYILMLCADNELRDPWFLTGLVSILERNPKAIACYTARYEHVKTDSPLSRYFALLGANDPLCWWMGKADRLSYLILENSKQFINRIGLQTFNGDLPSVGDNGFMFRNQPNLPIEAHRQAPMDFWVAMQKQGFSTFYVSPYTKLWHKSGDSITDYFRRRYHYVRDLYFKKRETRLWHEVERDEMWKVALFVLASVTVVPHLLTALLGFVRVRDWAWFLHPIVCLGVTVAYGLAWLHGKP